MVIIEVFGWRESIITPNDKLRPISHATISSFFLSQPRVAHNMGHTWLNSTPAVYRKDGGRCRGARRLLTKREFCGIYYLKAFLNLGLTLFRSIAHAHTHKGTQPDAAHWLGEFGPVPGAELVVKAHVYVLNWKDSKDKGYRRCWGS